MLRAFAHSRRGLALAIFLGVCGTLFVARSRVLFCTPLLEQGDLALNALQIGRAKDFVEIYGNYSRYGFNHPGPAFFYVYAAGEAVLYDRLHVVPSPGNAHLIAGTCLQAFFLALGMAALAGLGRWRAFLPLALAAAALFFGYHREVFESIWPPHVLELPFFAFLALATSVALGRLRDLGWLALVGGFLFHGHVAQAMFVGGIGLLALGWGWQRQRGATGESALGLARTHGRTIGICASLALVFLFPLALDLDGGTARSNVAAILARFGANAHDHMSPAQSLLYFLSYPISSREQDRLLTTLGPATWHFFRVHAPALAAWWAALIVPPILALTILRRRFSDDERRFFTTAGAVSAATAVGCLLWGLAQAGGMRHYNGFFYNGLFFFALLPGLALAAHSAERWWRSLLTVLVVVATIRVTGHAFRVRPGFDAELGLSVRDGVAAVLAHDSDPRSKLLVFPPSAWPTAAAVGLELTRHEIGFFTPPWWSFMFQQPHDAAQLGPHPERTTEVWWIVPSAPGQGGVPVTSRLVIVLKPAPLDPAGGRIDFAPGDDAFRYVVDGLSGDEAEPGLTNGRALVLRFAPAHATADVHLTFDAESADPGHRSCAAEVWCNGVRCGDIAAAGRREVEVTVPAAVWNKSPTATLELRFTTAKAHRSPLRPAYEWWSAWRLYSIRTNVRPPTA